MVLFFLSRVVVFTGNILFERRRFGLGCPSLYQVRSNNMLLVNVWICLMIMTTGSIIIISVIAMITIMYVHQANPHIHQQHIV